MKEEHLVTYDESQRQLVLMSLAYQALEKPGFDYALSEIAKLMDNLVDGRPQLYDAFKVYRTLALGGGLRIQLDWKYSEENLEWTAAVPAVDHLGRGEFVIHAICRPAYCDRGKFHVLIDARGVAAPDDQEGFPRYYFELGTLKREMLLWVNWREACIEAFKKSPPAANPDPAP